MGVSHISGRRWKSPSADGNSKKGTHLEKMAKSTNLVINVVQLELGILLDNRHRESSCLAKWTVLLEILHPTADDSLSLSVCAKEKQQRCKH